MVALAPLRPAAKGVGPTRDRGSERRDAAVRNWRKRSHAVSLVRRLLPLLMVGVVAALGWWLYERTTGETVAGPTGPVAIRMVNPTFRGRDDGRPFTLQAKEAVRDGKDYARIALVDPRMELQEKPGEPPTRITAQRGVYREDTLILDLEGDVRYSDAEGWKFTTRNAVIDTKRDTVTGEQGIEGEGPPGLFKADRYVIYNQGERVVLRGNVNTLSDQE